MQAVVILLAKLAASASCAWQLPLPVPEVSSLGTRLGTAQVAMRSSETSEVGLGAQERASEFH